MYLSIDRFIYSNLTQSNLIYNPMLSYPIPSHPIPSIHIHLSIYPCGCMHACMHTCVRLPMNLQRVLRTPCPEVMAIAWG